MDLSRFPEGKALVLKPLPNLVFGGDLSVGQVIDVVEGAWNGTLATNKSSPSPLPRERSRRQLLLPGGDPFDQLVVGIGEGLDPLIQ